MVVGWRHLDHVDAGDRQLVAAAPHRVEQLPGGEAAGLRGAGARGHAGVDDVHVDGQEDAVALIGRDRERLGQALVEAAGDDLGHLVGPHPLLRHPVQRFRARPVPAQTQLQEAVAAHRAGLDEPAHRLAVPDQGAELGVAGVGVRVEVDHRHPAMTDVPCHAGGVRPGDRVIAAEDHRDRTGGRDRVHRVFQHAHRAGRVAGEHLDVAGVVDPQVPQRVDAQRQGRAGAVVGEVAGLPDGARAEAGPGPV
ncbi:hypothetical protein GCM10027610_109150 [Dactylosporangium cerinum]